MWNAGRSHFRVRGQESGLRVMGLIRIPAAPVDQLSTLMCLCFPLHPSPLSGEIHVPWRWGDSSNTIHCKHILVKTALLKEEVL